MKYQALCKLIGWNLEKLSSEAAVFSRDKLQIHLQLSVKNRELIVCKSKLIYPQEVDEDDENMLQFLEKVKVSDFTEYFKHFQCFLFQCFHVFSPSCWKISCSQAGNRYAQDGTYYRPY